MKPKARTAILTRDPDGMLRSHSSPASYEALMRLRWTMEEEALERAAFRLLQQEGLGWPRPPVKR